MNWKHHIKIKHLFTEQEDADSIRASMNQIADVLAKEPAFSRFTKLPRFRHIPDGDDVITPLQYANRLLDALYDYADENAIWIG